MKKRSQRRETDWLLVVMASIMILIGVALLLLAIVYASALGWWALGVGATGLSTIGFAVKAIATNNRAWILLDLILP